MLSDADAREIADRFGLGDHPALTGPVARGELGRVWRLTTTRGAWAVKESFERTSHAEAVDAADHQDAARAAGIPVPALERTADGEVLVDVGTAQVRMYEWVDLADPDRWIDPVAVGRLVAAIHHVDHVGATGVDGWYTDPVGAAAWDDLIRQLGTDGADLAGQLAALRDELVALEAILEPPTQLETCHRDLFADNLRMTTAGPLCVIDWENSGLADPSQELAVVLFEFGCGDAARVRTLYDAYRDAGGPGTIQRRGDFSMLIAQLGHIGALACRDWLDPAQRHDRDRHAGRIAEFVSDPVTRDVIDAMLDAVSI